MIELADNQVSEMNVQLFDIYGRVTKTKTANTFKINLLVNDLPSGIYYLIVNEAFGKKIMIE